MSDMNVDLSNCDREPIHIPGRIQSHGFIIGIDQDFIIRFYSHNLSRFVDGFSPDLLGQPIDYLEALLGTGNQPSFISKLVHFGRANSNFDHTNPFQVDISGEAFYLIISVTGNDYLLEFEPAVLGSDLDVQKMMSNTITEVLADGSLQNLLNNAAISVKNNIQYDRVMIYRFSEDGHGEVVAEAKNENLEAWLGLHYPASDIPKQARELYKLNLTRLIADVHTEPSSIITNTNDRSPLDLTYSQLRAVSPIHIQYLKNMGVASSFSISLIYKKELWGLIACHNYTPRFIDYKARESSKLIGQILSSALAYRQDEDKQQINEVFSKKLDKLCKYLQTNDSIEDALTGESVNLLDVVDASGAALIFDKKTIKLGLTPDDEQLLGIVNWLKDNHKEQVYFTASLSTVYPQSEVYKHIASGMLVAVLSRELNEYLIWFKPEIVQTVDWAGNPAKPVEINTQGLLQISPRHSFDVWTELISGRSERWTVQEINSVMHLKDEIIYSINLKARAIRQLNENLKQAYEELDTFSFTISHELKNPISVIKSYAQLLGRDQTIPPGAQTIIERIEKRADKMHEMIKEVLEYSRIGRLDLEYRTVKSSLLIRDIVKDLYVVFDYSDLKITIGETPDLRGDYIMISQVFSNLIGNAVKYSQYKKPALVHIEGKESENEICYTIRDNGIGIPSKDLPHIFELFNRMDNAKDIEGSGVGLAIVKRIVEKHKGRIWTESEQDKGSVFYVSFNK